MLRKSTAAVLAAIALGLSAITVLGMATGLHTQFDKGSVSGWMIVLQLGAGAVFLGGAFIAGRLLGELWRGETGAGWSVLAWFLAVAFIWVVWAFLRIAEYSS